MPRPVTLFTGQWADLPFEEVARLASEWGYDGLEIACWGDHLDPWQGAEDDAYIQAKLDLLDRYGLGGYAISNHLKGQAVWTTRSTSDTATCSRTGSGVTATRRGSGSAPPRR